MWFAVGVLLSAVPLLALADQYPVVWQASGVYLSGYWPGTMASTPQGACQAAWATGIAPQFASGYEYDTVDMGSSTSGTCMFKGKAGSAYPTGGIFANVGLTCPWGGTPSEVGGVWQCINAPQCQEGEERDAGTGQCLPPPLPECANGSWNQALQICQCDAGWSVDTEGACTVDRCAEDAGYVGRFGTVNASTACASGCTVTRAGVANSACRETQHDAYGQPTSWMCDMRITGEHCTSGWSLENPAPETDAGPKDGEEEGCPVGYYEGTINGQKHCVMTPPATSEQTTEQKVTTHPDGTSTETTTTRSSEVKPDGSIEQTTTTTTKQKDASGNVTSTSTSITGSGSGLGAFCVANPGSQLCQGGGGFSGNCGAQPVCKGDAIQCAIAAATFEMNCQQLAALEEAQVFMDGLGGTEPTEAMVAQALNREGEFDFDIAQAFQDAQENYVSFTKSCLPPMGFTFKGHTYQFNTGFICEIGDFVRLMLHLVAYMMVLRIIQRAFG